MQTVVIALAVILALAVAGAAVLFFRRRVRRKAIDDILFDVNPLAVWTYSAEEWRRAVKDELSWGGEDDGDTQVRICHAGIYFKNQRREYLVPLIDGLRVVTFAGYLAGEESPLKLRTRWRTVTVDEDGNNKIKYYKEDFRIPVPPREKQAAGNVVRYFTEWLESNMELYTRVVPDDEPISLFGKDSF
jgi:hypothetical protein